MANSLDHKLFSLYLSVIRDCSLERTCEYVFVVLMWTSEELAGLRVLKKTCRCCGTE